MGPFSSDARHKAIEYSLMKERASALGQAGRKVQEALEALRNAPANDAALQQKLMYAAADCVWRYFVHREACGMREHADVIAEYGIPRQVLARVGARPPEL